MDPEHPADSATVARRKKDPEKLQSQLDDVNEKLKTYKQFQEGEAVSQGERDMSKAYRRVPVDQQMAQLLDKKKSCKGRQGNSSMRRAKRESLLAISGNRNGRQHHPWYQGMLSARRIFRHSLL